MAQRLDDLLTAVLAGTLCQAPGCAWISDSPSSSDTGTLPEWEAPVIDPLADADPNAALVEALCPKVAGFFCITHLASGEPAVVSSRDTDRGDPPCLLGVGAVDRLVDWTGDFMLLQGAGTLQRIDLVDLSTSVTVSPDGVVTGFRGGIIAQETTGEREARFWSSWTAYVAGEPPQALDLGGRFSDFVEVGGVLYGLSSEEPGIMSAVDMRTGDVNTRFAIPGNPLDEVDGLMQGPDFVGALDMLEGTTAFATFDLQSGSSTGVLGASTPFGVEARRMICVSPP